MAENNCASMLKTLDWCPGASVTPGIRRSVYAVSRNDILKYASLPRDEKGRISSATLVGAFVLREGAHFVRIDHLPSKAEPTFETQGEAPSQTILNKIVLVHPGVGRDAADEAAFLLNNDILLIVQDMNGAYRVIGSEMWETTVTTSGDLGQGATGTAATTITVEAPDLAPLPFYDGPIDTEDGIINEAEATEP